ncbi:hypothetical protein B7463_g825, partial [Scytalidium lignicola]
MAKFTLVMALTLMNCCFGGVMANCTITAYGESGDVLIKGTVLTEKGPLSDGYVFVQGNKITHVGSDSDRGIHIEDATIIKCDRSVISPGFINVHEHIKYATVSPLPNSGIIYSHRHEWRAGVNGHKMVLVEVNGTDEAAAKWGELRHIFSATTSIVGEDMAPGLARNLDHVLGLEEGLTAPSNTYAIFPLDDANGVVRSGDCDYGPNAIDQTTAGRYYRYIAHIGEGLGPEAQNEFRCLSDKNFDIDQMPDGGGKSTDIISANIGLVHALGLSQADFDFVAQRNAKVVWSPRSNIFLYGKTLNITYLLDAGITVALGTDWVPSGSATMAREAVCALEVTKFSYRQNIESKTLWEMMTINAAKVAGFENALGSLEEGKLADIAVFGGRQTGDPYAQAIYAPQEDIQLVMRGGKVLVATSGFEPLASGPCETVWFGSVSKMVCVQAELNSTFAAFEASLGGVYQAVLPGIPPGEPTCDPIRENVLIAQSNIGGFA